MMILSSVSKCVSSIISGTILITLVIVSSSASSTSSPPPTTTSVVNHVQLMRREEEGAPNYDHPQHAEETLNLNSVPADARNRWSAKDGHKYNHNSGHQQNWTPGNWTQLDLTTDLDDWSFLNNWTMINQSLSPSPSSQLASKTDDESNYQQNKDAKDGENEKRMFEAKNENIYQLIKTDANLNKQLKSVSNNVARPMASNISTLNHSSNAYILTSNDKNMTNMMNNSNFYPTFSSSNFGANSIISPLVNVGPTPTGLLNPLRIFNPLRNLILMSFEGYRRLMTDARRIEDFIRINLGLSKRAHFRSLDPLDLPDPVVLEHRDKKIPILGKVVLTLSDIAISGLSQFKVEQLDGLGRNLYFQHLIPRMDSIANYTIDYHLFDAIPFRVSAGKIMANIPNARVRGSFQVFPDLLNIWFRVAQLNLTTSVEDLNIKFYPEYLISERFAIEKSTVDKIHTAFNYLLPNITDILRLTYSKAIEMRLS